MATAPAPPATGFRQFFELVQAAGGQMQDELLQLPLSFGTGYLRRLRPEPGMQAVVHDCTLRQEVVLRRDAVLDQPEQLYISFTTFTPPPQGAQYLASVQVISSRLGFMTTLPAHTAIFTVGLAAPKSLLRSWLSPTDGSPPALLTTDQPLLLDVPLTAEMQHLLADFAAARHPAFLPAFYYRTKLQELLYWLLREVGHRAVPAQALYPANVEKICHVRTALLASWSAPPRLAQLAQQVGLNETMLKQLFRQVFGTSPYAYFQQARLAEAQRRLADLPVAEVGYQLGFTNLSHFARLFKKQYQLSPKQYQLARLR